MNKIDAKIKRNKKKKKEVLVVDNKKKKKTLDNRCGAKTQTGRACMRYPMANGRCAKHGGKSTGAGKGVKNAIKHGIYSVGLHKEEYEIYEQLELGVLDEEIRLAKIRLRRALRAQRWWEEDREKVQEEIDGGVLDGDATRKHLDIESVEETMGTYLDKEGKERDIGKRKILRAKRDYSQEIRMCTKLVAELEIKRKELMEKLGDREFMEKVVDLFREFSSDASGTLPGGGV